MRAGGYTLGGEQSGHVIMIEHATTGDGVLTALHVAARMAAHRAHAGRAGRVMTRMPQVLDQRAGRRQGARGDSTRC